MAVAKDHRKYFWAILITFLFTTLSGALRKWGVSSGAVSNAILGVQLLVPFGLVLLFPNIRLKHRFIPLIGLYALLLIGLAFNPLNRTYFHGVFGFILHFGFWYALFIYFSQRERFSLEKRLFRILLIITIGQLALSFIQYSLPTTHFLNRYVSETAFIAGVGDAVRVTGTFSYISGFSAFLIFVGLYLWSAAIWKSLRPITILVLLVILLVVSLMNGSRATLALSFFFIGVTGLQLLSMRNIPMLIVTGVLFVFVILLNAGNAVTVISEAYENFLTRVEGNAASGEQSQRIVGPIDEVLNYSGDYPVFGVGLGATYQGANALFGSSFFLRSYGFYEEEPERIILEGGFLLFIFRIVLIVVSIRLLRIPKRFSIPLWLLMIFYVPFIFNIYNMYYFLLGLILLDYAYGKRNQRQARSIVAARS